MCRTGKVRAKEAIAATASTTTYQLSGTMVLTRGRRPDPGGSPPGERGVGREGGAERAYLGAHPVEGVGIPSLAQRATDQLADQLHLGLPHPRRGLGGRSEA